MTGFPNVSLPASIVSGNNQSGDLRNAAHPKRLQAACRIFRAGQAIKNLKEVPVMFPRSITSGNQLVRSVLNFGLQPWQGIANLAFALSNQLLEPQEYYIPKFI